MPTINLKHTPSRGTGDKINSPILRLPDELLDYILDIVAPDSKELIDIGYKSSMSVESFSSEPPPVDDTTLNILSNVCSRFKDLVLRRKYARVSVRFTSDGDEGFERLRELLEKPHLCKHVLKFSFMVWGFSSLDVPEFKKLLTEAQARTFELQQEMGKPSKSTPAPDRKWPNNYHIERSIKQSKDDERTISEMMTRRAEQKVIIETRLDQLRILAALKSFKNLQQIRLMRIHSPLDNAWNTFIKSRSGFEAESEQQRWMRASEHATRSLGQAYLQSRSSASRISLRNLLPQTSTVLKNVPLNAFYPIGRQLVSLEVQFDNRLSNPEDLWEIATLFRKVFISATGIRGVHLGFARPVSIPFGAFFEGMQWDRIQYIGLGSWRLSSDEIISFLLLHRKSLRSVRFRGVLLEEESEWKDILEVLRQNLDGLKWVSLRSVGYSNAVPVYETYNHYHRYDVPDDSDDGSGLYLGEETESEDQSQASDAGEPSLINLINEEGEVPHQASTSAHHDDFDGSWQGDVAAGESENESDTGNSETEAVNDLAIGDGLMLHHITPIARSASPQCNCDIGFAWGDLRHDNGANPTKALWKFWEQWVIKRCAKHDPVSTSC